MWGSEDRGIFFVYPSSKCVSVDVKLEAAKEVIDMFIYWNHVPRLQDFFILSPAELEICVANKSQVTNY